MNDLSSALKIIESYGLTVVRKARRKLSSSNDVEEKVDREMKRRGGGIKRRNMTEVQIDEIITLWNDGKSAMEIARGIGCTPSTVYRYV